MYYIKEFDLMREVVFALQGLNGRIIRQDADGRFTITKSHIGVIDPTQRMLLEKLTSFGWLVTKINEHIKSVNGDPTQGKVSQSLAAALSGELEEHSRMVTLIEQQLQKCANQDNGKTRASTPNSDLYGCLETRMGCVALNSGAMSLGINTLGPKPSATYESLTTALTSSNGHHFNGHNNHQQHQNHLNIHQHPLQQQIANSDDGFGSQVYSVPSSNASPTVPTVTLHQIHVWTLDHYFRLKTLAMLVECCKGEKGGHLASIVYRFMQQGDKQIKAIITRIFSQTVSPIRRMLSQWIFHGEIEDPFGEFFICLDDHASDNILPLTSSVTMTSLATINNHPRRYLNQTVSRDHFRQTMDMSTQFSPIQHNRTYNMPMSSSMSSLSSSSVEERKYVINDYMMPGFISRQQANKILATGKAIHLLRKVCADSVASSVPGYDDLKKSFEDTNVESLFGSKRLITCGEDNEFEHLLNSAYKEVSQKALELLFGNYKLRSHFRGLRQYLLLGQGDFIRHLMDLLKNELDKPSSECRFHNILSVLESAMRSTNVQFDEPDVTNRLDCRLLDNPSPNATGWDIFSLAYKVDGPISTLFTEEKIRDYMDIFRQLWRTKRVEHVLTSLWSSQMHQSKEATEIPLLSSVFHRANILLSDMIHFVQHFQNYIMFEVVECSWVELVAATDVARDVDDVISAHDRYLSKIKLGTMCQKDTQFDCILEFQRLLRSLWKDIGGDLRLLPDTENANRLNAYHLEIETLAKKFKANRQFEFEKSSQSWVRTTNQT